MRRQVPVRAETATNELIANSCRAYDNIGRECPILGRAVGEVRYGIPASNHCIISCGSKIRLARWAPERTCLTTRPVL
jgi:hypothetical protein